MAGMSYSRQPHARSDSGRVRNRNRILSEKNAEIAGMTVHIIRKPIKNMYLRIKPPNADVEISAPQRMSADTIERFVIERRSWIERARLNLQLGLMNPKFLEYVLVHEMTHLWENGHGAGFQRRMDAYLPQWRQLRRDINRHVVL